MTVIIMQQEAAPDFTSPWPVTFEGSMLIHGKPDTAGVFGFTDRPGDETITVFASEVTDPEQIIGLYPVFIAYGGTGVFGESLKVIEAHIFTGDSESVTNLKIAEMESHDALVRLGLVPQDFTVVGIYREFEPMLIAGVMTGAVDEEFWAWGTEVAQGRGFAIVVQSLNAAAARNLVADMDPLLIEEVLQGE